MVIRDTAKIINIVRQLREMDIDGESMQDILEMVGMDEQMHRQLVMSKPTEQTELILKEKAELLDGYHRSLTNNS